MHMSKQAIISLSIGVLGLASVLGYIAYDTSATQDKTDPQAAAAATEHRSPDTVSPFGPVSSSTPVQEPSKEVEVINGISVPPEPDKAANNATVAGVDSNSNGVRDDIERMIAEKFGQDKEFYDQLIAYHAVLRAGMTNPTKETGLAYVKTLACFPQKEKYAGSPIERAVFNTPTRREALISLMRTVNNEGHSCSYYK